MTKQQALQKFNEEFQAQLLETIFPDELLPCDFNKVKHACLQLCSYSELRFPWAHYKAFVMRTKDYPLMEVAAIVNIFQQKRLCELFPYIGEQYYQWLESIIKIEEEWNKIVTPIRQAIERRLEIMSASGGQYKTAPIKFLNGENGK